MNRSLWLTPVLAAVVASPAAGSRRWRAAGGQRRPGHLDPRRLRAALRGARRLRLAGHPRCGRGAGAGAGAAAGRGREQSSRNRPRCWRSTRSCWPRPARRRRRCWPKRSGGREGAGGRAGEDPAGAGRAAGAGPAGDRGRAGQGAWPICAARRWTFRSPPRRKLIGQRLDSAQDRALVEAYLASLEKLN